MCRGSLIIIIEFPTCCKGYLYIKYPPRWEKGAGGGRGQGNCGAATPQLPGPPRPLSPGGAPRAGRAPGRGEARADRVLIIIVIYINIIYLIYIYI